MTAFLVHDLKTVFSQLSLLVENADKHKSNPDFIEDMINTVHHTTQKMQRLLSQLRDPGEVKVSDKVYLIRVIQAIVDSYQHHPVKISFNNNLEYNPYIMTDTDQLQSAIKHIIQNGASTQRGEVTNIKSRLKCSYTCNIQL